MLIKHIDKIARERQRGVLFVTFVKVEEMFLSDYEYAKCQKRKDFIQWLELNHISYMECGGIANENTILSYKGQLYIDIPYDENLPEYQKLNNHLEHLDGRPKIDGVFFYYLPLDIAMKNQHHDEDGFWEKWAEDF